MGLFDEQYPGAMGGDFGQAPLSEEERYRRALELQRAAQMKKDFTWQGQPTWPQQTQYAPAANDLGAQAQGQYNQQVLKIQKQLLDDAEFEKMLRKERAKTNSIGMFAAAMSGRSFTPQSISGPSRRGTRTTKPDVDAGDIEKDLAWDEWMQNPGETMDDLVLFAQKKNLSPDVFKFMREQMTAFDKGDMVNFHKYDLTTGKQAIERGRKGDEKVQRHAKDQGYFSDKASAKEDAILQLMEIAANDLNTKFPNGVDKEEIEKFILNTPAYLNNPLLIDALNRATSLFDLRVHVSTFYNTETGETKVGVKGQTVDALRSDKGKDLGWVETTTEEATKKANKVQHDKERAGLVMSIKSNTEIAKAIRESRYEDAEVLVLQAIEAHTAKQSQNGRYSSLGKEDVKSILGALGSGSKKEQKQEAILAEAAMLINQIGAGPASPEDQEKVSALIKGGYVVGGDQFGDSLSKQFEDAKGETTFVDRERVIIFPDGTSGLASTQQQVYTDSFGTVKQLGVGEFVTDPTKDQVERIAVVEEGENGEFRQATKDGKPMWEWTRSALVHKNDRNHLKNTFGKKVKENLGLEDITRKYMGIVRAIQNLTTNDIGPGNVDDQLITMLIKMRDESMVTTAEHELQRELGSVWDAISVFESKWKKGAALSPPQRARMFHLANVIYKVSFDTASGERGRLLDIYSSKYGEKGKMFPQSSGYRDNGKALEYFFTDAGIDVGLFNERPDANFVIDNNPEYFGDATVTTGPAVVKKKKVDLGEGF
jgi:hypothetical protein